MDFNSKKLKRKKGTINFLPAYYILAFITILISFKFIMSEARITNIKIEDALASSTLASATVDLKKYADEGLIVNIEEKDIKKSYNDFLSTLKKNLNLNDSLIPNKSGMLKSIKVEKFIIYSDLGSSIQVSEVSQNGVISRYKASKPTTTPNGIKVEDTTIYSQIGVKFNVVGKNPEGSKFKVVKVSEKDKNFFIKQKEESKKLQNKEIKQPNTAEENQVNNQEPPNVAEENQINNQDQAVVEENQANNQEQPNTGGENQANNQPQPVEENQINNQDQANVVEENQENINISG